MLRHGVEIYELIKGFILARNLINVSTVTRHLQPNTSLHNTFLFILAKSLISVIPVAMHVTNKVI